MKKQLKATTVQTKIINALQSRLDNAPNANFAKNMGVELKQFSDESMLRSIESLQTLEFDFSALIDAIAIADAKNSDYIAIYALQKIRKAVRSIAQGIKGFDGYTNSILHNLCNLQTLSNINAQRSICNKIEFSEDEQCITLRRLHNCAPSTASTQASSTRMMLKALNVCNVRKGAKGDSISFTDAPIAAKVQSMFA